MALSAFLEVPTVTGESIKKGMEKKIELIAFNWGGSNSRTIGGSGQSGGVVALHDLSITKELDMSTAPLLKLMTTGKHFDGLKLFLRKQTGDGKPETYATYTLNTVFVTSINHSGAQGGQDRPTENVTFAYGDAMLEYGQQQHDGSLKVGASWKHSVVEGETQK
jgi:type VI secretion system secreted protein Hcp